MKITAIPPELTWDIRHRVMWPHKSIDYVKLPEDDSGLHYGLWDEELLLSIVSLFPEGDDAQFRKFATLHEAQGQGYGSKLLEHLFTEAANRGVRRIWCNARASKAGFYRKFGMTETEVRFEKDGERYVMMEKWLQPPQTE